jgi:hypothetical protein
MINIQLKGKEMTSLRHRLVVAVSALVVLVAIVVLPGCKKQSPSPKPVEKKSTTEKALKDME